MACNILSYIRICKCKSKHSKCIPLLKAFVSLSKNYNSRMNWEWYTRIHHHKYVFLKFFIHKRHHVWYYIVTSPSSKKTERQQSMYFRKRKTYEKKNKIFLFFKRKSFSHACFRIFVSFPWNFPGKNLNSFTPWIFLFLSPSV